MSARTRGNVTSTTLDEETKEKMAEQKSQVAPRASETESGSVVWKSGRVGWERVFQKGDGKGPNHATGFSRRYEWTQENNWTVTDMDSADVELLKSLTEDREFRHDE